MQTTGELIRLLGYVDDIAATLHRIDATIPTLTPEQRKRLAEYMRKSDPNFIVILESGFDRPVGQMGCQRKRAKRE